jgi:hypothetical protein
MSEQKTEATASTGREASDLNGLVNCLSCGYAGTIDTYNPTFSLYSDIRCPKCASTNNQHNSDYFDRLSAAMKDS